jgi:hypothetical protein
MQIGIVGTGNVGAALGTRWAQGGHEVVFGSRHPQSDEVRSLIEKSGGRARAASVADAATCPVILLATPWAAAQKAIETMGSLQGKTLIDAVNPVEPSLTALALGTTTSASEQIAQWAAGAHVVKAFNTVGAGVMANTDFSGGRVVMFYCGDHAPAKQTVHQLAAELGFDPVDAGPLTQARLLEPFALLWITLAIKQGLGMGIAFELLRR